MNRRDFLSMAAALPFISLPSSVLSAAHNGKILVLLELKGGNDGLNTLIPYQNELYYRYRPNLAIRELNTIILEQGMAMHPALRSLDKLWDQGDLAWVRGVGYPDASESHFLAQDVWNTALKQPVTANSVGWLDYALPHYHEQIKGVSFDQHLKALMGKNSKTLMIKEPQQFIDQVGLVRQKHVQTDNVALAHVLDIQSQLGAAAGNIASKLKTMPRMPIDFPKHTLGKHLQYVAQMIAANIDVPIYKLGLGSFDTHINQAQRQSGLLYQLSEGLSAFRAAMQSMGRWDDVIVMTYSEFGRRVQENGSGGTDHGTASVQLIAGGQVKGGLYGRQPDLENLDNGNLRYTTDFRSSYATLVKRWLGESNTPWGQYPEVGFL